MIVHGRYMCVGNLDKSKMQLLELSEYGKVTVHKTNFTQIYFHIHAETTREFILDALFRCIIIFASL